jgi:Protein of unknown function (DUF2911)
MLLFVLAGLMTSEIVNAQKSPPKSPPTTATGKVGGASISIAYCSPSVRGRKIFGGLEPYGKAWRAGANEATIFQTDKDITVEGKPLKAGKYSLFVVPGETEWEFILNTETGQWGIKHGGDANFDPAKNAITFKVKPTKSAGLTEQLTYVVSEKGFALRWENVDASVAIK